MEMMVGSAEKDNGLYRIIALFFLVPFLIAGPAYAGYSSCADIPLSVLGGKDCLEVSGCGYLEQEDTYYLLRNDLVSNATCLALIADNITLDLNGYRITYDDAPAPNISVGLFEEGIGDVPEGWDLSAAPNITWFNGTYVNPVTVFSGHHSIRASLPLEDQEISTIHGILLRPNTTYALSMMVNINYEDARGVIFSAKLDGTSINVSWSGRTHGRFSYQYIVFKTGNDSKSYNITFGIRNASNVPSGYAYIDDVLITKHRSIGIAVAPTSWRAERTPDLDRFGSADHSVIKDGAVWQGRGGGDHAHAISMNGNNDDLEIDNVTSYVYGCNSQNLRVEQSSSLKVHDSLFLNNVTKIINRHGFDGGVIHGEYSGAVGALIYNNTIIGSPQNGIYVRTTDPENPTKVYQNNISLTTRYTNGFAIQMYGDQGSLVYNNFIDCVSGDYSCRGIFVGSSRGSNMTRIHDNIIMVKEMPRNQEYNGCILGGAYGIQIEHSENIDVYRNEVYAYSDDCESIAMRINPTDSAREIHINDNNFTSFSEGKAKAATFKLSDMDDPLFPGTIIFRNNTLTTNNLWLYTTDGVNNLTLDSNRFCILSNLSDPFLPLYVYDWKPTATSARDMRFINNSYPDGLVRGLFEEANWTKHTSRLSLNSSFILSEYLDLMVVDINGDPVDGALVTLIGSGRNYSNQTGKDGKLRIIVDRFINQGGTKITFAPYEVNVSYGVYSSLSEFYANSSVPFIISLDFGYNAADMNRDGCVSSSELRSYLKKWRRNGDVGVSDLLRSLELWKGKIGCRGG